jgi:hypothetical protein
MKKLLLSAAVLMTAASLNAQIYSASDTTDFQAWTFVDTDGDGFNWDPAYVNNPQITAPGFDQAQGLLSNSWATNPLTPDNLAISPAIDCTGETTVLLNWAAGSPETTASGWYEEKYAVYVVTAADLALLQAGTYPTPVFETVLAGGEEFFIEEVDVSTQAAGNTVYVVLRHYDCTDENWILVDYLNVSTQSVASLSEVPAEFQIKAYPNPAKEVFNIALNGEGATATLISMDGKVVASEEFNGSNVSFNVAGLVEGAYIYEVVAADGTVIRDTFVKQ